MVFETVRRARRRILTNDAMRHAAYAVSAALTALILLLLLGTQILSWAWLFVLPALMLAAGAYLTWRRAPSLYSVAQQVDQTLKLADTLSTAVAFADKTPASDMQRAQWSLAERVATQVDPRHAIPIRPPRALYASALLTLVAGSLFALRYGLDRRLDLRPPLARMVEERLGYTETRQASANKPNPPPDPKHPDETGFSLDNPEQKGPGELDAATDSALNTIDEPNVDNRTAPTHPENTPQAQSASIEGEQNQDGEATGANATNQESADGKQGSGQSGKSGKQGQGDDKQGENAGENSGLLSKFRDAMSSLMNRMRQQGQAQGSQQNGAQQKSQSANAGQNGKQGQQPGNGQQAGAKDAQPGEDGQSAQSASQGQNGEQPSSKQPGSGIGRQDGSKDVKLAEQLAAMGKITEIIGKRSANVTGDLTVEVQNSNQQLRTPYAQRDAQHAQAGAEINRDEIPAALQAYVQQYFEQVRKPPASPQPARTKHRSEPPKPGM